MKGHLPAGRYIVRLEVLNKEIAVRRYETVTRFGLNVHRNFRRVRVHARHTLDQYATVGEYTHPAKREITGGSLVLGEDS